MMGDVMCDRMVVYVRVIVYCINGQPAGTRWQRAHSRSLKMSQFHTSACARTPFESVTALLPAYSPALCRPSPVTKDAYSALASALCSRYSAGDARARNPRAQAGRRRFERAAAAPARHSGCYLPHQLLPVRTRVQPSPLSTARPSSSSHPAQASVLRPPTTGIHRPPTRDAHDDNDDGTSVIGAYSGEGMRLI
ncbi:hypothetical protein CALCODRAFT_94172 [Calocera cornea HHB12733]|uniref:Uncharacterized protein n=1 Tax=Calocera cornea HHB12733 TaxID=1353952 RepID=A0A165D7V1_9BASI|nr:hypothetical protein CALCODRAFT_94172 [Calocera cornea HHB12733]